MRGRDAGEATYANRTAVEKRKQQRARDSGGSRATGDPGVSKRALSRLSKQLVCAITAAYVTIP